MLRLLLFGHILFLSYGEAGGTMVDEVENSTKPQDFCRKKSIVYDA